MNHHTYTIQETCPVRKCTRYVCAPKGYYRTRAGKIRKDNTRSPEWSYLVDHAYRFISRMSAHRTLSTCGPRARIISITEPSSPDLG